MLKTERGDTRIQWCDYVPLRNKTKKQKKKTCALWMMEVLLVVVCKMCFLVEFVVRIFHTLRTKEGDLKLC